MFGNSIVASRITQEHEISRRNFETLVVPVLRNNRVFQEVIQSIAPRVSYGKDFTNFTLLKEDPNGWGVSEADVAINHYLQNRTLPEKRFTVSAFITNQHNGRLSSCGLIRIDLLADNIEKYGAWRINERTGQKFKVLPFSHSSIRANTLVMY